MEDESNHGVTHMMEHLSFKSTATRSHATFVRDLERIGGAVSASSGREQLIFSIDLLRDFLDQGLELLADSILHPALVDSEIESIRNIMAIEIEAMEENPQGMVHERMHEAAYGPNSPLGRTALAPVDRIANLDTNVVKAFLSKYFVASRMVLAASGVEHERLVALANKYFKDLPKSSSTEKSDDTKHPEMTTSRAIYQGGEVIMNHPDSIMSYAALAFDTASWHEDDLVPICVLQTLLGGGDSFSAGGPGKGMYSRLYTSVLNRYHWVESASAFTSIHADAGLIGIYGAATPEHTHNLVAILCNQFVNIATQRVSALELSRAKNQLKSSLLMNLESRMILNDDIGRQLITYGKRESPESLCLKIDAITDKDLLRVARKALDSKPSVVFYGDASKFPSYDQVQRAIQEGLVVAENPTSE